MNTSRRDFLKAALGAPAALSLGSTVPALLARAAVADPKEDTGRVLVAVQLAGGNDGLNTVVPYDDDAYGRNRKTLRLAARDVLKIEPGLGLHPQMTAFKRLLDEGHLAIVQGVGYPKPQGGHGESMRIWQTARLDAETCQTGWLGRAVDRAAASAASPGVFVGQIPRPLSINAARMIVPTISSIQECLLHPAAAEGAAIHKALAAAEEDQPDDSPLVEEVRRRTRSARASAKQIEKIVGAGQGDYPSTPFAGMLRIVAQLIDADVGIRIFHTELGGVEPGGFDNHAEQKDNHAALLRQLAEGVGAFIDDLRRRGALDRVLLFTFSEFGRTLEENGRRGTNHGSAAPMFLAGGRVNAGLVGKHPSLDELENGGPRHHTDFRRIYAAILDRWLQIPSAPILSEKFEPLEVLA